MHVLALESWLFGCKLIGEGLQLQLLHLSFDLLKVLLTWFSFPSMFVLSFFLLFLLA